jgi:alkylated DNA nucleotide flippase Atl1
LQRNLLEAEGIVFDLSGKIDMEKFQWKPGGSEK